MNNIDYLTDNDWKLLKSKYPNLDDIIPKLEEGYPVQYLIGDVEFYGNKILVDERVLIPRFETEGLVEKTIDLIKQYKIDNSKVLEVGTGSGCISITLKKEIPTLNITSIDLSKSALELAKENTKLNDVSIELLNESIFDYTPIEKYDVLISNPPYIAEDEKIDPKTRFEPSISLYAKEEGMEYYRYMIKNANRFLNDRFIIAFEIGYLQGNSLKEYASNYFKEANIFVSKDLSGKDRYLFIINE